MRTREIKNNPKEIFNPTLFWDAEDIDIGKNAGYIISRVLNLGDEKDIKTLKAIYSDEEIIEVIKRRRGLMPQTAKFWAHYFNIPFKEIICLRMCYQSMQQK
jgi:hypothetical protein